MEPRPDWNAIGPRLPAWFRPALKRVDARLRLQYMPPRCIDPDGVDDRQFPYGVWTICRVMPGSKWLMRRWTMSLSDERGQPQEPGPDTIAMLRYSRDVWRRGEIEELDRALDTAIESVKRAKSMKSRERLRERVIQRANECSMVRENRAFFGSNRKTA